MTVSRLFSSLSLENHNSTPRSHPPVIREPNFGKLLSRNSIKRSTSAPHSTINSTRKGRTEMYQKSVKLSPCRLTASRRQIAMTRHAFNHCLADTQFESSALTVRESSRRAIKRARALATAEKGSINVNNSTRTRRYWQVPYGLSLLMGIKGVSCSPCQKSVSPEHEIYDID